QFLWVRPLDALQAHPLAGTEGAMSPFWSPDSRYIAYSSGGMLYKVALPDGVPQALAAGAVAYADGTWGQNDVILYTQGPGPLYRVSAMGGAPVPTVELDPAKQEIIDGRPHFLPDGRHFLFFARSSTPENNAIYLASLDSKERKRLFAADSEARYATPG